MSNTVTPVSRRRKIVSAVISILIIVGLIVLGWYVSRDRAASAKVGDCVAQTGTDTLTVVDCADPTARFTVVGRIPDKTQAEATVSVSTVCSAFSGVDSTYWEGEVGKKGFVLCLARNAGH